MEQNRKNKKMYTKYIFLITFFVTTLSYRAQSQIFTKGPYQSVKKIPPTKEEQINFCGEYHKENPKDAELQELKHRDRFGNRYSDEEISIIESSETKEGRTGVRSSSMSSVTNCDCQADFGINTNYFELYFEDCMIGTGTGFDDPTQGADRRRTVCQVYADLSNKIQQTTPSCGTAAKVRVRIIPSDASNYYPHIIMSPLPSGVAGIGAGYNSDLFSNGIREVYPWQVINTGVDPLNHFPNSYHGYIRINFTNFSRTWNIDHTTPPSLSQVDLYTVVLHEATHMLGMGSYAYYNGSSFVSAETHNTSGAYTGWDKRIQKSVLAGNIDFLVNPSGFNWEINGTLSNPSDFLNTCNGTGQDLEVGATGVKVYTGTSSTYNRGSSMSHLDETCTSSSYVMHPSVTPGIAKQHFHADEDKVLEAMGYTLNTTTTSTCQVIAANDYEAGCTGIPLEMETCVGNTFTIKYSDIVANDINVTGIHTIELAIGSGTLTPVTPGNPQTDYTLTLNYTTKPAFYIRYIPEGCSGQLGNEAFIRIQGLGCGSCAFQDVAAGQALNPYIVTPPGNCGLSESTPRCIDCGFNKNPHNLICNPEFCAANELTGAIGVFLVCPNSQSNVLPGWNRAGYALNLAPDYPIHSYSYTYGSYRGALLAHEAPYNREDGAYTKVNVVPNKNYFMAVYVQEGNNVHPAHPTPRTTDFFVDLITDNAVSTYFDCSNFSWTNGFAPHIPLTDRFPILTSSYLDTVNSSFTYPYTREGTYFQVPTGFTGDNLYFHVERDANGETGSVSFDQPELVEDNFTAGPDQNLVCGQFVALGGVDYAMPSEVNVQYTWTNMSTGQIEMQYTVEKELDGTYIIQDILNGGSLTQIPTFYVQPSSTTTYQLSRAFIADPTGLLGLLDPATFSGAPLTDDVVVTVPVAPTADPVSTYTNACYTYNFTSHSSSLGNNFSHAWDFDGDGVPDSYAENPTYTYAAGGTYTVTHMVNNGCGNMVSNQTIVVTDDLSLSLVPSSTGPFISASGSSFTMDVIITNTTTTTANNIVVDVPPVAGLNFTSGQTTIPTLLGGQTTTIPIAVTIGTGCGTPQMCATILSTDNVCIPATACSPSINVASNVTFTVSTTTSCINTGSATISPSTATSGIMYSIDGGVTTNTTGVFTHLIAGNYDVMITEPNGCISTQPFTIVDELSLTSTVVMPTCAYAADGSIDLTITSDSGSYTVSWSKISGVGFPHPFTEDQTGMYPGIYRVLITDVSGCQIVDTFDLNPTPITGTFTIDSRALFNGSDVSCTGAADGVVTVTPMGGEAPYTYNWIINGTSTVVGNTATATGLSANNNYRVRITDNNGCSGFAYVTLTDPIAVQGTANVISSYNGAAISCNGSIRWGSNRFG